jgi:Flp pilus assembly protein TadG
MAMKRTIQQALRRFGRDRRGNYGMMMAIVAPMLLVGAGFGINVAQVSNARSNLLAALDAAVTSTARDITVGVIKEKDADSAIESFLLANGQRTFARDGGITLDNVIVDTFRKTVMAEASVVVDVAFPLFGAANQQTIHTMSKARYSDRKIEVAMMLDVTGSMAATEEKKDRKGNVTRPATDKIGDLQAAATIAVEALLDGNKHSPDRIRVALVPYAASVNVGEALARSVVFQENGNGPVPPQNWKRPSSLADYCATERKMQDGAPDFSDYAPDKMRTNVVTVRSGRNTTTTTYDYPALVNRSDQRDVSCPSASVIPLTTDEQKLKDEIAAFEAKGSTAGGIATQWTYYMLSQKWRDAISNAKLGDGPADPNPEKLAKIAILMTDGEYNLAFAGSSSNKTTNARNNAETLCTNMKRDGIEIFTIGFALPSNEGAAARTILKDCASRDTPLTKHFYDAADGDELKKAFQDIVRNIERLALIR